MVVELKEDVTNKNENEPRHELDGIRIVNEMVAYTNNSTDGTFRVTVNGLPVVDQPTYSQTNQNQNPYYNPAQYNNMQTNHYGYDGYSSGSDLDAYHNASAYPSVPVNNNIGQPIIYNTPKRSNQSSGDCTSRECKNTACMFIFVAICYGLGMFSAWLAYRKTGLDSGNATNFTNSTELFELLSNVTAQPTFIN